MANQLRMPKVHTILTLRSPGWSFRRIGRELGVHRETVQRYVRLAEAGCSSAELSPASSDENRPNLPTGLDGQNRPNPPTGLSGPASLCEPFREAIIKGLGRE